MVAKLEKADPTNRSRGWGPNRAREETLNRGTWEHRDTFSYMYCYIFMSCVYDSFATKGVHTYTAEDFGGQVFVKLADDYSYVVVLKKRRREKNNCCD